MEVFLMVIGEIHSCFFQVQFLEGAESGEMGVRQQNGKGQIGKWEESDSRMGKIHTWNLPVLTLPTP